MRRCLFIIVLLGGLIYCSIAEAVLGFGDAVYD
jgi:hypothetical protein